MAQFIAADSPLYGTMYWDSTASATELTVAASGTFYGIQGFSNGVLQGITTDLSDATADHFTIPTGGAGDYVISYDASILQNSSQQTTTMAVFVGGVFDASTKSMHWWNTNGLYTNIGASQIVALADADTVDLRYANETSTGNVFLLRCSMTIRRIS